MLFHNSRALILNSYFRVQFEASFRLFKELQEILRIPQFFRLQYLIEEDVQACNSFSIHFILGSLRLLLRQSWNLLEVISYIIRRILSVQAAVQPLEVFEASVYFPLERLHFDHENRTFSSRSAWLCLDQVLNCDCDWLASNKLCWFAGVTKKLQLLAVLFQRHLASLITIIILFLIVAIVIFIVV